MPVDPHLQKIIESLKYRCGNYLQGCKLILPGKQREIAYHQNIECEFRSNELKVYKAPEFDIPFQIHLDTDFCRNLCKLHLSKEAFLFDLSKITFANPEGAENEPGSGNDRAEMDAQIAERGIYDQEN